VEDRHIRLLEIAERLPLGVYGPAWDDAFASYLQELGCPLVEAPYARARIGEYVSWLVSKAFSVIYEESAEQTNADVAAAVEEAAGGRAGSAGAGSSTPAAAPAPETPLSAEAAAQLSSLAAMLGVSVVGGPVAVLAACRRAIRHGLLPAAAAAAGASSAGGEGGVAAGGSGRRRVVRPAASRPALSRESALAALPALPTGVAPSSPAFNAAAAVLRLLYVDELRELQDGITASLIGVQEFTADPRTDASLGQVGR
jgi:RLL motif-containing protein 1